MEPRQWPIWQIAALILVVIAAVIYVAAGALGSVGNKLLMPVAQVPPTSTAPWPSISTKTPTPTSTPTGTPGPSPTSTYTPAPTSTPTITPTPSPTPIVVITGIHALGRLETAQYVMQTVVDLSMEPTNIWQQAFGTDKLLLIAKGEVVAGFDMTQIEESDIVVQGTSVNLTLPSPEILYSRVDNGETYVYSRETGLFVPPNPQLESEARRLAELRLIKWANENKILDKATDFGTLYLESFLRSLGFTEIKVQVHEAAFDDEAGRLK